MALRLMNSGSIYLINNKDLKWHRYTEGSNFDYPIDYSDAVVDARNDGHLELLVK